jgi:5-methyltetrahydrofolate--homocysteine methyltransferase
MPLLVGQRINGEGSRRARQLLLAGDYDGIVTMAREQLHAGADVIDVCVALHGVAGEAERMAAVVRHLAAAVDAPLMIDSHDPQVLARGLEAMPGRHAILNSVSLQHGTGAVEDTTRLALDHGAAIVGLCIDETGMARTVAHKLDVARRLYEVVVNACGLPAASFYLDPLVFALPSRDATWAASAVDTLDALKSMKQEWPEVRTIAGICDVSYGLPPAARQALDAVFLHHCTKAGLDAAIVDPARVPAPDTLSPAVRDLADAVVFNHVADAMSRFTEAFAADR